jgi:hypothetical protein
MQLINVSAFSRFLFLLIALYLNPDIINVYLVDVVSGSIVFSMNHRRARGPVQIVHSENWLVYSYHNEKIRRNEISKYFLYYLGIFCASF